MLLNSFNNSSVLLEPVQTVASPKSNAKTKAAITVIGGSISTLNKSFGNSFNPSTLEIIFNFGMMAYPDIAEKNAAPTDEI